MRVNAVSFSATDAATVTKEVRKPTAQKYTPTNTPMGYYAVTSPSAVVEESNRVSGTNYIAVSGEPINSAVGNQECIEIVAVIPAAVSFLNPPGVEGGIVRTVNYNITDGAGNILIGNSTP